jgi:ribonuclease HI
MASPISIVQWNANGLRSKAEFQQYLYENNIDIACIQDTNFKPNFDYKINCYTTLRKDRQANNKGGVAILIKTTIPFILDTNSSTLEVIAATVQIDGKPLNIVNFYLPPGHAIDPVDLEYYFNKPNVVVVGDFNAHHTMWTGKVDDPRGQSIADLIETTGLIILNTKSPTYIHYNGTTSLLDLSIVSPQLALCLDWYVINSTMGSDHFPIQINININKPATNQVAQPKWNLKQADWLKFNQIATKLLSLEACENTDVHTFYKNIITGISDSADASIPLTKPNNNPKHTLPYWNEEIKAAIKSRNKALSIWQKTKTLDNLIEYKRLKAVAQRTIRLSATNHWQNYCTSLNEKSKTAEVWKLAKKLNGKSSNHKPITLKVNSTPVVGAKNKANTFASHFSKVSSDENYTEPFLTLKKAIESKSLDDYKPENPDYLFNSDLNVPLSYHELDSAIKRGKLNAAPGADKITYEILKNLPRTAKNTLLKFYNNAWSTGVLPHQWKSAIVLPFLKIGKDPSDVSSYRPIALTSCVGKIMERIITTRLMWFLEKNNIISPTQSGFRANRSTEDNIARLSDAINKALSVASHVLGVFIDFEKAYDMVWRTGLLIKLKDLGLNGNIFNYIKNFFTDTFIQVRCENTLSDKFKLQNGVIQGSVISPILFLIMINDLTKGLKNVDNMAFADDLSVYKVGTNVAHTFSIIQIALIHISKWCNTWGFKINTLKSQAVLFMKSYPPNFNLSLKLNNINLILADQITFLGMVFDRHFNWNPHINYLKKRAQSRLNLLKILSGTTWGCNKNTQLKLYRSLIKPILLYGAVALSTASYKSIAKIEAIQHKSLIRATHALPYTNKKALQVYCNETPIHLCMLKIKILFMAKVKNHRNLELAILAKDHWTTTYGTYRENRSTLYSATADFFNTHKEYILEAPIRALLPPWVSSRAIFNKTIILLENKNVNPLPGLTLANEIIENSPNSYHIYTDASVSCEGKAGIGVYIKSPISTISTEISLRINNNSPIYKAELFAIYYSLLYLSSLEIANPIAIFSDSMSAISSIESNHSNSNNNLVMQILSLLDQIKTTVTFIWIPSHIGIIGNELVDKLAVNATSNLKIDIKLPLEINEIKPLITKYILSIHQSDWNKTVTQYKDIHPNINTVAQLLHPQRIETLITRLKLGKCLLNHYSYKLKKHPTGLCDLCHTAETIDHFLFHCKNPVSTLLSTWALTSNKKLNLSTVLNDPDAIDIIVKNKYRII